MLAKICGDINKPNGQYRINPCVKEIEHFLETLPIRKVGGIGGVTEQLLKGIGVNTCGDLWEKRGPINLLFTPATVSFLLRVSLGVGHGFSKDSEDQDSRKSISCERTFKSTGWLPELKTICEELCKNLEMDLHEKHLVGKTVTLKIKLATFQTKTRAKSLLNYTANASVLFSTAWSIFQTYVKDIPQLKLRLMGVRVHNLKENGTGSSKQHTIDKLFSKTALKGVSEKIEIADDSSCDSTIMDNEEILGNLPNHEDLAAEMVTRPHNEDTVQCPVCNKNVKVSTDINKHIDECLNLKTVKEIMKTGESSNNNKRSFTEAPDAFSSHSQKRLKTVKIDSFFKKDT